MGWTLLLARLVRGNVTRHLALFVMLVVVVGATAATMTLGLVLRNVAQSPFSRTMVATNGPDLVVEVHPGPDASAAPPRAVFGPLQRTPGVTASAGPFPVAFVRLTARGVDVPVDAEGRSESPTAVDQPRLTSGAWVRPGEVVLEQGLASTLGLRVGDHVRVGGEHLRVGGVAAQTEQPFYPAGSPGLVWVTATTVTRLATPSDPLGWVLDLTLAQPQAAPELANGAAVSASTNGTGNGVASIMATWQDIRELDYKAVSVSEKAMLVGSWLLSVLAVAGVAVVVSARMAEQTRRVGLLKAVGAQARTVVAALFAENLLLALAGAAAGLVAGRLLAPSLSDIGQGLLGAAPAPSLTISTFLQVALTSVAVVAVATVVPSVTATRATTLAALAGNVRPPKRKPGAIALSARLPVPLLLGLRLATRRPRRTVLTGIALTVAVTAVVAANALQYQVNLKQGASGSTWVPVDTALSGRVTHLMFVLGAVLVVLGAAIAVFTTWATVMDGQRYAALARALGASPGQVAAGFVAAQLVPGLLAGCLGAPAGLAVYALAGGRPAGAGPPFWLPIAVVLSTLVALALLTSVPARVGARRSIPAVLQCD